jgi:hypothetical protein
MGFHVLGLFFRFFATAPIILPVLATWIIRSGNRHFENGKPFLYRLQTKADEGKIGSRHCILMLERRPSHVKEQRIL